MNDYRFAVFDRIEKIFRGTAGVGNGLLLPEPPISHGDIDQSACDAEPGKYLPAPETNILLPNPGYETPILGIYTDPDPPSSINKIYIDQDAKIIKQVRYHGSIVQNIPGLFLTADSEQKVSGAEFGGGADTNTQVSNLRIRLECVLETTQGPPISLNRYLPNLKYDPIIPEGPNNRPFTTEKDLNYDLKVPLPQQVYGFIHDTENLMTFNNVSSALQPFPRVTLRDIRLQEWALVRDTEKSSQVIVVAILLARITLPKN